MEGNAEHQTHFLDLPHDIHCKIFASIHVPQGDAAAPYLDKVIGAASRHALYCSCRALRQSLSILITRLRVEVSQFAMDGTELRPPYTGAAQSIASYPKLASPLKKLTIVKYGGCFGREPRRVEDSGWGYPSDEPFFMDLLSSMRDNLIQSVLQSVEIVELKDFDLDRNGNSVSRRRLHSEVKALCRNVQTLILDCVDFTESVPMNPSPSPRNLRT